MLESNEILKLALDNSVEPEELANIHIKFELTIPKACFRLGYQTFDGNKITMSLGNWYPILAVYKDGK